MNMLGIRMFATKYKQDEHTDEPLSQRFNFPKHKEVFADHYYEDEGRASGSPYEKDA